MNGMKEWKEGRNEGKGKERNEGMNGMNGRNEGMKEWGRNGEGMGKE